MTSRGPPPALSIPAYSQPQGPGSGGSDSYRARERNRSTGGASSAASSRDHSLESRGSERRSAGAADYRSSRYGGGEPLRDFERNWTRGDADSLGFQGRGWSPKGRIGASNWAPGAGSDAGNWRSTRDGLQQKESPRSGAGRGRGRGGAYGVERPENSLGTRADEERKRFDAVHEGASWGSSEDRVSHRSSRGWGFNAPKSGDAALDSPLQSRSSGRGHNRQSSKVGSPWQDSDSPGPSPRRNPQRESIRNGERSRGFGSGAVASKENVTEDTPKVQSQSREGSVQHREAEALAEVETATDGARSPRAPSATAEATEVEAKQPEADAAQSRIAAKQLLGPVRGPDWYEICLEEEEQEERQAKKREEALGLQLPGTPPGSSKGDSTRRKSSLSRQSSARSLGEAAADYQIYSPGPNSSKKGFGRKNSFGRNSLGQHKGSEGPGSNQIYGPNFTQKELHRKDSFGRDLIPSPNSSRGGFGRKNSIGRDHNGIKAAEQAAGPQFSSPGSAKGEFKPWNSVREDAADAAQLNRSNAQKNAADSRVSSRGEKYVPLALRKSRGFDARSEPQTVHPLNPQLERVSGDAPEHGSSWESTAGRGGRERWKAGIESQVGSATLSADAENYENREPEKFNQTSVNTTVRPSAFFRALNEAAAGEEDPLPHIVGTCPDMCPVRERLQRERLRDLALFERVNGDTKKTNKELAVKKFCRTFSVAEIEQSDVRPLPVLWKTLQYLLGLLDHAEFSFDIVHNFLFDRTRAIRQELGMQRIQDYQNITIHEEIVRFHILSEHELRELNRKRSKQFDTHLNLQQLSKSLYSLLHLYITLGGDDSAHLQNEAEFHAYYVLLNIGNHGQFQAEPLSLWFPNVPSRVLQSLPMQFVRKVLRCYRSNNFVGFFRLVKDATYLQSCLMELCFSSLRATTLAMLNVAEYKLHPFPLEDLGKLLIMEENEVEELCTYYGLVTGRDKTSDKLSLFVKQSPFATPESQSRPDHCCPLIESKRAASFLQVVKGVDPNTL